ncbi:DEAD/DEAH box helicase [Ruegeria arenilitoris]|uniref:DEAD/DEAH box helicase n=1 Tax=Ruegeria arenilitoris TaxID=1173585 RepID=UPI003C7E6F1C
MIGKIRRGSFYPLYIKLFDGSDISDEEKLVLLSIAIECHRSENEITRNLGYRIVVAYTLRFQDLEPLLTLAANEGFAPLVDSIIEKIPSTQRKRIGDFAIELLDATIELFESDGAILTNAQWTLSHFFNDRLDRDVAISAPTSFGKSELIVDYCRNNKGKKICILVPTKALIAQTRQRLLNASKTEIEGKDIWKPKLVMHPDSHWASHSDAICIYTQERLFRHFVTYGEDVFSHVLVDEAHNVFGRESREILLNQALILHKSRSEHLKQKVTTKFFTPFLVNPENIAFRYQNSEVDGWREKSNIKSEKYIVRNFRGGGGIHFYDQFFDRLNDLGEDDAEDIESYIQQNAAEKNIIYQNRPIKAERMVRRFVEALPAVEDARVQAAAKAIEEYVHPDYLLGAAIRRGILYHHGSVPDVVKLYVEHLFSELDHAKYILCNSTLLEGVNIPATRLFLPTLGIGRGVLNSSQFKNLVGRVCRYKEIFGSKNFDEALLMPEVHILINDEYMHKTVNIKNFLSARVRVDLKEKDINQNPLIKLEEDKIDAEVIERVDTFLDVIDPTARDADISDVRSAHTTVGYKAFIHNIREIDILLLEREIQSDLEGLDVIQSIEDFLELVGRVFIARTEDNHDNFEIRRLISSNWQGFYAMLLRWRIEHVPLPLMVKYFADYWADQSGLVYVGRWGDTKKFDREFTENWVDFSTKSESETVNLAIVRLQDEYDFIETYVSKYIELIWDLGLLSEKLYSELKYGTNDSVAIELIKAGFNNHLAFRLLEEYSDFVEMVDDGARHLVFDEKILEAMELNEENPIVVFETRIMAGL